MKGCGTELCVPGSEPGLQCAANYVQKLPSLKVCHEEGLDCTHITLVV